MTSIKDLSFCTPSNFRTKKYFFLLSNSTPNLPNAGRHLRTSPNPFIGMKINGLEASHFYDTNLKEDEILKKIANNMQERKKSSQLYKAFHWEKENKSNETRNQISSRFLIYQPFLEFLKENYAITSSI